LHSYNIYCICLPVTHSRPPNSLPPAALREFKKAAKADWQGGVTLAELLSRINRVAALLVDDDVDVKKTSGAGRVRRTFTERSFRHYQTLGCISVPEKQGRAASYGFRHFLQALLVRKLLWERLPAEQIATTLGDRGTEELERMLLGGVEMVARAGGGGDEAGSSGSAPGPVERWSRVRVVPGLELHISADLPRFKPAELRRLMELMEQVVRRHGS